MNNPKPTAALTDDAIVEALRHHDPQLTRDYFYDTCRIAYHVCDKRYDLAHKPGLDFYSIAHEYYLALSKRDFHQLDGRGPGVSLRTWMVNGFRFVMLDRLKAYNREAKVEPFEDRLGKAQVGFDLPDDHFSADFRATIMEMCHCRFPRDSRSSILLRMILVEGFKGKEVAEQLGMTPSAVTQRYRKLMETVVVPYFKANYVAPETSRNFEVSASFEMSGAERPVFHSTISSMKHHDYSQRVTPEVVTSLAPGEIFVFGSNLAGMHGGGAARAACLYFGAKMGVGVGPQGHSYAIPTMQGGVDTIRPYVDQFVSYARQHPDQVFLVTPIGCGIAGFEPCDIAPLFAGAVCVSNIHLPQCFWDVLAQQ